VFGAKAFVLGAEIDWDKFDGLFDAFWLGRRVKSRSMTGLGQGSQ
jgi:hypothetical protein